MFHFILLVVLAAWGLQLEAALETDLASLEVQLGALRSLLPEPKKPQTPFRVLKDEFDLWPEGTEIKINGVWQDFKQWNQTERDNPNALINKGLLRTPEFQRVEVELGKESYQLWKATGFRSPLIKIENDVYEDFRDGVKIEIARQPNNIELIVGGGKFLDQQGNDVTAQYTDENEDLLGVVTIQENGNKLDPSKYVGTQGIYTFADHLERFIND